MYKHKTLNTSSRDIIARGNYTAKVIENVIFKNKNELLMKERYYIQNNECVNKYLPIIYFYFFYFYFNFYASFI
jgi:hypothetical protein